MKATAPLLQLLVAENILWIATTNSAMLGFCFVFLALRNARFTSKPAKHPPLRFICHMNNIRLGRPTQKNEGYRLGRS